EEGEEEGEKTVAEWATTIKGIFFSVLTATAAAMGEEGNTMAEPAAAVTSKPVPLAAASAAVEEESVAEPAVTVAPKPASAARSLLAVEDYAVAGPAALVTPKPASVAVASAVAEEESVAELTAVVVPVSVAPPSAAVEDESVALPGVTRMPASVFPATAAAAAVEDESEAEPGAAVTPQPASVACAPGPHVHHSGRHPLASMCNLLTSSLAFLDATDGNASLPESLRKEVKRNAFAAARMAEVAKGVKLETPPLVWVSQYYDMSKRHGLAFLLSDGRSGVAFKDGTKIVLEADGAVFEYVGGGEKRDSRRSSRSSGKSDIASRIKSTGGGEEEEPSTTKTAVQAASLGTGFAGSAGTELGTRAGRKKKILLLQARNSSSQHLEEEEKVQKDQKEQQKQRQRGRWDWRRPERSVVYAVDNYPGSLERKVVIARKVREHLGRTSSTPAAAAARMP
ncbi:unnamed protein product, partial [Pylaiella littoralis]